ENYEGLRVNVDEGEGRAGWIMNRMSLHDPVVIFNVESVSVIGRHSSNPNPNPRICQCNW
ncbi:unnamed protein product, partial [Discosporangium mesarthrocarpum]